MPVYTPENTVEKGLFVRCFVDGMEINQITYLDTDIGFIKKYVEPIEVSGEEFLEEEINVDPSRMRVVIGDESILEESADG